MTKDIETYIYLYYIYINIYNIKLKLIFSFCHFVIVICHIVTFIIITSKRLASFFRRDKKGRVSKYYLHMQNIVFTSKKAGLPFRKTVFYKKGYFIN